MRLKGGRQILGEANDEGGDEISAQLGVTVVTTPRRVEQRRSEAKLEQSRKGTCVLDNRYTPFVR